jgi:hypothetical protein
VGVVMRSALVALLCVFLAPGVAAAAKPPPKSAPTAPTLSPDAPRVLLVFVPGRNKGAQTKVILKRFEQRPGMALGVVSSTAGRYDAVQTLLDITAGTRTSYNVYKPKKVPELALVRFKQGGAISGWYDALRRAEAAPEEIHPGLLASSVPGGAGYAGLGGRPNQPAIAAANQDGLIPEMSLGKRQDLVARTEALLDRKRFVVVGLPARRPGGRALDALLAARRPNELIIAMREPPSNAAAVLLPIGAVGLGKGNLTSGTSRHDGIVAGIDILPTVLDHLDVKVPKNVKGQAMRAEGKRSADSILDFEKRSRVVSPRRLPTLEATLLGWLAVILLLGVIRGPPGIRRAMRAGGLAALWLPFCLLIPATFTPTRTVEYLVVAGSALVLGLLTDLLLRWPRGPMLPAAATLLAYTIDLANGSPLIVRSLLGPNPRFGSRFYGLGNELEALIPIITLVGLAAVPWLQRRSKRNAAIFGVVGLALGAIVGSGRLGADVGGVITVGSGFAVATMLMLPGKVTWKRVLVVLAVPVLALAGLAALDILTGGNSHFTRTVLGGGSAEFQDTVRRRYELAFNVLRRGLIPILTGLALLAAAYGVRHGRTLFTPVADRPAWRAALGGSLAGCVAGALTNDSGPMLIIFGVILLTFVTAYLRGDPRLLTPEPPPPPEEAPAEEAEPPEKAESRPPEPATSR